jgi:hypothetical protein
MLLKDFRPHGLRDWPWNHCLLRVANNCHDQQYFFIVSACVVLDTWKLLISLQRDKKETKRHSTGPQFNAIFLIYKIEIVGIYYVCLLLFK